MGLKGVCDTFLSPLRWSAERRTTTPVPSSEEGNYGAGKQILSNLRLARCKATGPWLWLAGLAVCTEREGVPLPRSGGGWEGADASAIPYKHRLAHAPGGRRPSGRAFRCVGVLGQRPKRVLVPFTRVKGTPRRRAVLIKSIIRLSPPEVTTNPPRRVGVPTKAFYKTFPTGGDSRLFHERPAGKPYKSYSFIRLSPPKATANFFTNIRRQAPANHFIPPAVT